MKTGKRGPAPGLKTAPPVWLVNVVWLAGFFLVWDLIALLFRLAGQADTKFPLPPLHPQVGLLPGV